MRSGAHKIAELLADERCSQAVLVFLATTDVGRPPGPPVAEEGDGAASEALGWENREQLAGRGEARGRGTGRITVRFSSITLYFSVVFHLPFFVIQLLAVSEQRLLWGNPPAKVLLYILVS